jgi:hypothetical protein
VVIGDSSLPAIAGGARVSEAAEGQHQSQVCGLAAVFAKPFAWAVGFLGPKPFAKALSAWFKLARFILDC